MNQKLRFAIIGCGKIAPRHAEQAARIGELAALCDIDEDKAATLAARYSARAYNSIDALIRGEEQEIDIAAVCTPNGLHAAHSIAMLRAGAHVLCEKPLCITSAEANAMIQAAGETGRKLFVVKSTRYNPALIELKKIIDTGQLGRLYSFQLNCFWNRPASYYANSWKGSTDMDGGTLYTQFSHYIDAMLWLFGDISSICGFRKNTAHQSIIGFEDSGVVSLEMNSGLIGGLNWSVNTFHKNMEVSLTLIAEKGAIRIGGEYMNTVEYQLAENVVLHTADNGSPNDYGSYKGSMSNHDKVYDNLLIALEDEAHPFSGAADGLKTVTAIEKIYNCVSLS